MYSLSMRDPAARTPDNRTGLLELSSTGIMDLLIEFLGIYSDKYVEIKESTRKSAIHVPPDFLEQDVDFLTGYIEYGHYGIPGKIVNIKTSAKHRKSKDDSDIQHLYFLFYLPKGNKRGIALFHKINNVGVKSVIDREFNISFLKGVKNLPLKLDIKPITKSTAAKDYMSKIDVKKLILERFRNLEIFGDAFNNLPADLTVDIIFKAPRGGIIGSLDEFSSKRKDSKYSNTVVLANDMCGTVKSEINVDGRTRVTELSSEGAESRIIITENDVEMEENFPKYPSMNEFSKKLAKELLEELD
jgi:hypothetical protein